MRTYVIALLLMLAGCGAAETRALDALDRTSTNAASALAGIAAVATAARSTLAAVASTAITARAALDAARPNMVRATDNLAALISESTATIASMKTKVDAPVISTPARTILYALGALLAALLAATVWNTIHLHKIHRHVVKLSQKPA